MGDYMGTQFWWFYDVLAVAMTFGICYVVIAKGFNKVVFQLAAFVVAMLAGVLGANLLAPKVYNELFREQIRESVRYYLENTDFDIYESVSEIMAISSSDEEETPDAQALRDIFLTAREQDVPELEEWYMTALENSLTAHLKRVQKLHPIDPDASIDWMHSAEQWIGFLSALEENGDTASAVDLIESTCYRANYTQLLRLVLFLLIELVMLIICSIIASMNTSLEQSMHLRRGNHALAIPVALVETASMLFIQCVTVRFIVQFTDGEMLMFNQPTINETYIFQYIYGMQDVLFGNHR